MLQFDFQLVRSGVYMFIDCWMPNTNCPFQANYYIAFVILSDAMEDSSFGLKGIHVFNVIINYVYLGLLIMCYLLALGNRPQGSKWGYTTAFIGFAVITVYMTVCLFPPGKLMLSHARDISSRLSSLRSKALKTYQNPKEPA